MRLNPSWSIVLVTLLLAGCPTTEPEPEPEPEPVLDGVDPSVPAGEGEARAGRVRAGEGEAALFGGLAAEGRAGDFMIYNRQVRYVIQDAYEGHGYVGTGGGIIDFDLVRPEGALGRDGVDDFFLSNGVGWLFGAERIQVLGDGSDGEPAWVQVTGGWELWEFINGTIESDEPVVSWTDMAIVIDYRLPPESRSLEITTTLTNRGSEVASVNPSWGYLSSDEDMLPWAAGQGNDPDTLDDIEAIGGAGIHGEAAFALWQDEGLLRSLGLSVLASSVGISVMSLGWTEVEPGDTLSFVRYLSVAPDTLSLEAERLGVWQEPMGQVTGTVTDPDGQGVRGIRLHFVESGADEPWIAGFAETLEDGTFQADVPVGDWDVYAVGRATDQFVDLPAGAGRVGPFAAQQVNDAALAILEGTAFGLPQESAVGWPTPEPQQVTIAVGAPAQVDFLLEPGGTLVLDVTDDSGVALPAYVDILWADGSGPPATVAQELKERLGIPASTSRYARVWIWDGHTELPILPGTYDVWVEHSWRHDRAMVEDVEIVSGEPTPVAVTLTKRVPHDGWLSMDSHLHAAPSNDGHLPMEHRVVACAATGVDLPVNTDHDRMADYRPIVTALGLDDRMQFIPGVEVSPVVRGHFNLYPVDPKPLEDVNGGTPMWWELPLDLGDDYTQEDLFAEMRAAGTADSLIQSNHPRSPGLFSFSGYSPDNGQPNDESMWSWGFDTFELINGTGRSDFQEIRADWFSFLDLGRRNTPVGTSDSHSRSSPCGYGRTDVYVGTSVPSEVTPAMLSEAIRAGHTIVSGGVTLRLHADGALPGDTLTGAQHTIDARVLGPDWVRPAEIRLIRNGDVLETIPMPSASVEGVWWEGAFEVDEATDAWYVVEVEGTQGMGGVWHGGVAYAAGQAYFVDVDGDGWEAPGLD
jgi:hypothetical protein